MTLHSGAQIIKQGDTLNIEFKKLSTPYFFNAPALTGWIEGANMLFIGSKPNPNDCSFLFIALKDSTLIGVFRRDKPNKFIFDTEGNSILSSTSDIFLLPLWTVKNRTRIDSTDKAVLNVLDRLYETTMQADDGHPDEETLGRYRQFQSDTSLANRHIGLLFDNYQTIISETSVSGQKPPAEICIPLMKTLAVECLSLYNMIPPIICIYMGEALQNADMKEEARKHFKMSLQFYPNSIPLLIYNYQLEEDPVKKKQQLAELKRKYPNHWMVKNL